MYYLLIYQTVESYVEKRAPFRSEHLDYSGAAHSRGELFMGGALGDPPDSAILIFRADTPAVAEEFARNDPYVKAGLIREWSVRPWTVVIGG
ncbi:MAG: YciI-like protein [Candidatus Aminicenantales bacterium]